MYKLFQFTRAFRLKTKKQFSVVIKNGEKVVGSKVVFSVFKPRRPGQKLGITASRKFGKAVQRNRFKRVVREAFRTTRSSLPESCWINSYPRFSKSKISFADVLNDMSLILQKTERINDSKGPS